MKSKTIILLGALMTINAQLAYADVVWPALYVADSHFRFWYITILGILLEAGVFSWRLKIQIKKALLISFVVNAFSATVGIYILVFGMLGWHFVVDNFVNGTFASFNEVATIVIMLFASAWLETLIARLIWKYEIKKSFPVFILGNVLSYGAIVIDLFLFGGWQRQF